MNTYFDRPDGEVFADVPQNPIPEASTWEGLSVNQLIEVKNTLTTRALQYANKPDMVKPLYVGIQRLDSLITKRLSAE